MSLPVSKEQKQADGAQFCDAVTKLVADTNPQAIEFGVFVIGTDNGGAAFTTVGDAAIVTAAIEQFKFSILMSNHIDSVRAQMAAEHAAQSKTAERPS